MAVSPHWALIFGTNGGMGAECSLFVKALAKELSNDVLAEDENHIPMSKSCPSM